MSVNKFYRRDYFCSDLLDNSFIELDESLIDIDSIEVVFNSVQLFPGKDYIIDDKTGKVHIVWDDGTVRYSLYDKIHSGNYNSFEIIYVTVDPQPSQHVHTLRKIDAISPTCILTGNIDYWKCLSCGSYFRDENGNEIIKYEDTIIAELGHTPGSVQRENVVLPTCSSTGHHDEVIYCTVCQKELSRNTITDPVLEHVPGDPEIIDRVNPTCQNHGSYTTIVKCTLCNFELSRVVTQLDKLDHNPGSPVTTVIKDSTCSKLGQSVVTVSCTVCNQELSKQLKNIPRKPHTLKNPPDRDIITESTCCRKGSYIEVNKCTVCNRIISRKLKQDELSTEHRFIRPASIQPGNQASASYLLRYDSTVNPPVAYKVKVCVDCGLTFDESGPVEIGGSYAYDGEFAIYREESDLKVRCGTVCINGQRVDVCDYDELGNKIDITVSGINMSQEVYNTYTIYLCAYQIESPNNSRSGIPVNFGARISTSYSEAGTRGYIVLGTYLTTTRKITQQYFGGSGSNIVIQLSGGSDNQILKWDDINKVWRVGWVTAVETT